MNTRLSPVDHPMLIWLQPWLVRLGYVMLLPSLAYLPFAMAGILPAEQFSVGEVSGLKVIGSCAVFGCLAVATGYWDS